MDNKDYNRDKLLDEILRETASRKISDTSTSEAAPRQQPNPKQSASPASPEPEPIPSEEASVPHTYAPEPEISHTASRSVPRMQSEYTDYSRSTAQMERPPVPTEPNPLYEDLDGESQTSSFSSASPTAAMTRPRKKRKQHRVINALIMIIVIIAVSVLLSSLLIIYGRDLLGINSDSSTKIVTIPPGASVEDIASVLQKSEIIDKPEFFVFIAGMSDKDKDIKPGDHELRPDMAYETILSELISDPLDSALSVSVTFPEGIRLVDAASLLEENNICDAEEFLDYFNHDAKFGLAYEEHLPSFLDDKFYRMEGYFFPDTYTFYQEMDVELVSQKILDNFNSKITPEYYERMEALNISLDETIILASMIQAEAGNTEQMPNISSVFWNRLNNATEYPLLQSDPTTKYVEEVIKPHSESYNEALYISYDTYQCTGLPAGAIGNPGGDAIYAALYPANTSYYYFYSNIDTKETFFAKTNEEHEANKKKVQEQQAAAAEAAEAETAETEDSDDGTEE